MMRLRSNGDRPLKLKYAPTVGNAYRFADLCVESFKDVKGIRLDYSPSSLYLVDETIEGLRQDGCTEDQVAETLFTFGCYVGEVLVRNAQGVWRDTPDTPMRDLAGMPLVVELGNGQFCNPIGKTFKRLNNGMEDHLPYFYKVFVGEPVPEPPKPQKKPWWKLR